MLTDAQMEQLRWHMARAAREWKDHLASDYGVTLEAATKSAQIESHPEHLYSVRRLPPEEQDRYAQAQREIDAIALAVTVMDEHGPDADFPDGGLPPELVQELRRWAFANRGQPLSSMEAPGLVERAEIVGSYALKTQATPEEVAETARLYLNGGPLLSEWIYERAAKGTVPDDALRALVKPLLGFAWLALDDLVREEAREAQRRAEEAEQALQTETERREQTERKLAEIQKSLQLSDRFHWPRAVVDAFRTDGATAAAILDRVERSLAAQEAGEAADQLELLPADENTLELLRRAETTIEGRQLGHLTTPEIRALAAVLHIFSSRGDDGKGFTVGGTIGIPARLLYSAARINPRQPNQCRALFSALDDLSREEVYLSLKVQDGEQWRIVGEHSPLIQMRPVWSASKRADADRIAEQWGQYGLKVARARRDGRKPPKWTGPPPDDYVLTLPPTVCRVFRSLVVSADILDRLQTGAKRVRGENQGFQPIDFALFLEITQTTQGQQVADDGKAVRSYVDRDEFIEGHYGPETVRVKRERGHYNRDLTAQYETAAEVLLAGEIVTEWKPEQQARRGKRDVFTANPAVVFGLQDKAERALARQRELTLPPGGAPTKGRKPKRQR